MFNNFLSWRTENDVENIIEVSKFATVYRLARKRVILKLLPNLFLFIKNEEQI